MSTAKTAEAIEMSFASRTRAGPGKHLLPDLTPDRFDANIVLYLFNTIQPYETRPSVQTLSDVCLKRNCSLDTSAFSALEVLDDNCAL